MSTQTTVTPRLLVDLQLVCEVPQSEEEAEEPPSSHLLEQWAQAAYVGHSASAPPIAEIALRIVDAAEMVALNTHYRGQNKPTNVLSFPAETPEHFASELSALLLGDVVICHAVVVAEARQQGKSTAAHYAHMVTHGILHLCGFDHQHKKQAQIMERVERDILMAQGFCDPYAESPRVAAELTTE